MATLLEKALAYKSKKRPNNKMSMEELELVTAWLNDEIQLNAIIQAKGIQSGAQAYCFLAQGCRELWRRSKR